MKQLGKFMNDKSENNTLHFLNKSENNMLHYIFIKILL